MLTNRKDLALAAGEPEAPSPRSVCDDALDNFIEDDFEELPDTMTTFKLELIGRQVRFDGASHQSGKQRGWVNCRCNRDGLGVRHEGCYKYRFVKDFPDGHVGCASWLLAWDAGGPTCRDREEHYAYEPVEDVVSGIRIKFGMGAPTH